MDYAKEFVLKPPDEKPTDFCLRAHPEILFPPKKIKQHDYLFFTQHDTMIYRNSGATLFMGCDIVVPKPFVNYAAIRHIFGPNMIRENSSISRFSLQCHSDVIDFTFLNVRNYDDDPMFIKKGKPFFRCAIDLEHTIADEEDYNFKAESEKIVKEYAQPNVLKTLKNAKLLYVPFKKPTINIVEFLNI